MSCPAHPIFLTESTPVSDIFVPDRESFQVNVRPASRSPELQSQRSTSRWRRLCSGTHRIPFYGTHRIPCYSGRLLWREALAAPELAAVAGCVSYQVYAAGWRGLGIRPSWCQPAATLGVLWDVNRSLSESRSGSGQQVNLERDAKARIPAFLDPVHHWSISSEIDSITAWNPAALSKQELYRYIYRELSRNPGVLLPHNLIGLSDGHLP